MTYVLTGSVENQGRALVVRHFAELDLFGSAVSHTILSLLFNISFVLCSFCYVYCVYLWLVPINEFSFFLS